MLKQVRVPQPIKRVALIVVALLVLLTLIEVGLRLAKLMTEDYYIWLPNLSWQFEPSPDAMPGVEEGGTASISAQGLRGDDYDPNSETIHILTLGGSTTECLYLDQPRTWPELMSDQLAEQSGRSVWVGNAARSSMRSPESVLSARYLLPQLGDVDYVIAMLGVNDMIALLRKGTGNLINDDLARGYVVETRMHRTFSQWPNPLEHQLQIVESIESLNRPTLASEPSADTEIRIVGDEYKGWREMRQSADRYEDTLPNLDAALAVYRMHLESLVWLAQQNGAEMVFVTQPALYSEDISADSEALLWFGNMELTAGQNDYYSTKALLNALDAYNRETLAVCHDLELICIDAALAMNANQDYFYDDVHFNYLGAEVQAKLMGEALADAVTR